MSELQKFSKGYLEKFHEPRLISGYSGKVCTDACFMMLEEIPSEDYRVTIKGYNEVLNLDDIENENDFYVDYTNNYIYFHKSKMGQTITVDDYYGIGLNFIGASRIIVRSNVTEDVIQTLEDLIEQAKLCLEAITTLGGATEVIEQLKEDTETGRKVDKQLKDTIEKGNATVQAIKDTGNKSFIINTSDWIANGTGYKYKLKHNLQSIDLHVSMIDLTDNMASPSQYKIIDINTIEIYSMEVIKANVVISARYFNGIGDNVGNKFIQEVADARNGMTSLGDKIRDMDKQVDNKIREINSSLETIETLDLINNDLILFASYQSGNFSAVNDFTLYVGKDTEKCYPVNNDKIIDFITNRPLWDIACFFANDKFYFIGDYKDTDAVWGGNSFLLLETEDLINFKQTPFKIRSSTKNITQTWAPKIFKDGERYYLIYCIQENNETYIDTNLLNITHQKLRLCYSVALDNTFTNWSEPTYFNINSDECYIDPFMYKLNGVYHLFACYDNNAEIRHFTSQSLNGSYELKGVVPFPNVTEAPSVIDFNNKFYLFVDSHRATGGRDSGLIQVMESDDLNTWSNLKTYKNTANTTIRHFAPLVINTTRQKEAINNLFKKFRLNNNYIDSSNSILSSEKNNISYFDLASITPKTTKAIDELYVMPNTIYYMNSYIDSITINKINASKLKNFDTFSFVLNSFGSNKLIIKNNSDKGGFLPIKKDLIINGNKGSNLITFTVLDGYIKCHTFMEYVEDKYMFNFVQNGDFKREDLSMFGGMNGYTPTLDESKDYLKIEETGSTMWKGVAQDITLQENKKYRVSAVVFTKDKSLFTDGIGLTIKGVRTSGGDVEFGADYINQSDIVDYIGKKMSFIIDTSTITLSDYNRIYVYLFLKKQGCIYVKDLRIEYSE